MTENRKKLIFPFLVVAGALVVAVVLVMTRPVAAREDVAPVAPLVRVVDVELGLVQLKVRTQGTLTPERQSDLVAQVSGRIADVSPKFGIGGEFAAGEVVVRIDPRDYELAVQQATAALAQAKVRLQRESAEASVAREEWGALGRGEPNPLALRVPQLAEAEASVQAAEAAVAQAELNLERTAIRAPFAGRLATKHVDLGQFVAPGTPVGRIFATAYAEVELPIPPEDAGYLDLGMLERGGSIPVEFETRLGGDVARWTGRVVRSTGRVDERTRMSGLIARVDSPYDIRSEAGQPLQMGQFVDAWVLGREVDGIARLPRSAMRGANRVLVIDDERKLRFREVEVLRLTRDEALVRGGLRDGELVLVSPMEAPVDGMTVQIATGEGSGAQAGRDSMESAR
jgi:membrane fusion protein, multidrug efflux system